MFEEARTDIQQAGELYLEVFPTVGVTRDITKINTIPGFT